jgi:acyl-coenzyme A thioesterase PaaI-like protein
MSEPHTHLAIDRALCGEPLQLSPGAATVALITRAEMAADERGLVHGGFVFGLADYAAMLAIDHPNVVLGAAEVRFLAPTVVGERLVAEARIESDSKVKKQVRVEVVRAGEGTAREPVFSGLFTCFVPAHHVLERGA